ncbi:MAG: T9SS type A sorting domain-containing protein [Bacteroidetes bacterium]|nr:T9SS type A sorting domain-containing protein [Bacteroidota bacterium]
MSIYPNPVVEELNIHTNFAISEIKTLQIINPTGQKLNITLQNLTP